jgi:hypothetical protein
MIKLFLFKLFLLHLHHYGNKQSAGRMIVYNLLLFALSYKTVYALNEVWGSFVLKVKTPMKQSAAMKT